MPYATAASYYFFDKKSDAARESERLRERSETPLRERRLFCARCRHPITVVDQRVAVNGAEEHEFVNPLGIRFHIACFRHAPGCSIDDLGTLEHTWFAGYAWSIASCAQC